MVRSVLAEFGSNGHVGLHGGQYAFSSSGCLAGQSSIHLNPDARKRVSDRSPVSSRWIHDHSASITIVPLIVGWSRVNPQCMKHDAANSPSRGLISTAHAKSSIVCHSAMILLVD